MRLRRRWMMFLCCLALLGAHWLPAPTPSEQELYCDVLEWTAAAQSRPVALYDSTELLVPGNDDARSDYLIGALLAPILWFHDGWWRGKTIAFFRYGLTNIFPRRIKPLACERLEVQMIDSDAHRRGQSIASVLPENSVMLNFTRVGFSLNGTHAIVGICLRPADCGNCYPHLLEKSPTGWRFAEE